MWWPLIDYIGMPRRSYPSSEALKTLIGEILALASARGLPERELAIRAGIRPETFSRMKAKGTGDLGVIDRMARIVGKRLALVADNEQIERLRKGEFF